MCIRDRVRGLYIKWSTYQSGWCKETNGIDVYKRQGDQGGQIYIRGGAPVQNKILLDGLNIFNPFHSIGFYSIFETELIKNVDVLTGGFGAEYGGRISAIVDIKTREGNKARTSGFVSGGPFMMKGLIEGPIKKFKEGGSSVSYVFTAKKSLIDQTSKTLYSYATRCV